MLENSNNLLTGKKSLVIAFFFVFGMLCLITPTAFGETTCRPIRDWRWPGLEECTTRANIVAKPASQKMPLWCWAASLSMIYTVLGHPISQESIVRQNFGRLINLPSGPFPVTVARMNRSYTDDNGDEFTSSATQIYTMEEAQEALDNDIPLFYSTQTHATVQTELKYQQVPGGPMVIKGGRLWDPWPTKGWRKLDPDDVMKFVAAWSIEVD